MSIEQDLFTAGYIIRKLVEAGKLSNEVESTVVMAKRFDLVSRSVDFMNRHKLDELFDLEHPRRVQINLVNLCNQLIHSFVFEIVVTEELALAGIYIASDRVKKTHCYYISIDQLLKVMTRVYVDDVMSAHSVRDPKTGEMKSVARSNMNGPTFCQLFDFPNLIEQ